jgi:hypothetical protein
MTLSEEQARLQASLGLPQQVLYRPRILYAPSVEVVLMSCTVEMNGEYTGCMFHRKRNEVKYSPLNTGFDASFSIESPILAIGPVLFVLVYQSNMFRKVLRLDLQESKVEEHGPEGLSEQGVFLSELTGTDESGDTVYALAGFYPTGGVGPVPHHLVSIVWSSGEVSRLSAMRGAFY